MANISPPLLSRREIEDLIAAGGKIFILDQFVIKANGWIPYHPGGDKSILHMVGRDATDEVTALHSAETKQKMSRYRIGRIEGRWTNFIPPIQGGKFRSLVDNTEHNADDSVSSDDSRGASLVFDSDRSGLRHRGGLQDGMSSSTSVTSASSAEENDGMAHLNTLTREKISLDLEKYPPVDHETQDAIVAKYRLLHDRIKAEGLYDCSYSAYAVEACRYSLIAACMYFTFHWGWYALSAVFLGALFHQLAFVVHDAGHIGITHNFHIDTLIGMFVADYLGGLSIGWWKRNHNVHHIVTNSPENDPDVEYLPFLALSHRFFGSLRSTYYEHLMEYDAVARFAVKFQHYAYYPLMLFGRFNLYRLAWLYLLGGQAPRKGPAWWHWYLEITGQFVFWYWYGYLVIYRSIPTNWDRFAFFMVSHMIAAPLHVQLTLSHFAMSMADLGPTESFPQKMIRTTMDIDCPQWLDFFHGGLQFQVVHHLYPRIPRHNLRRTQKLVQEFCTDVGIPYALYGFVDGNRQVVGALAEVSRQAAILAKCQQAMTSGSFGHAQ
ncbi:fatty acid desaturase-domain-containing protein [Aspergillus karnatakaensis]|uniref:fatty acid desaturase-domain-containing protein n=1 Tax=Aspergillus karnatakaensis TaxID=1810916 RepID=UPI003CCDD154